MTKVILLDMIKFSKPLHRVCDHQQLMTLYRHCAQENTTHTLFAHNNYAI